MDSYGTARLAAKDAESAIVARICEDFNLTPVLARAHYEQMARYFAEYGQVPARPGELCYLAVAAEEPAGKPIAVCRQLQVRLELAAPEDVQVLQAKGLAAMRQGRLARLARQARVQGALLTVEDLAYLTCSSPATIKRDLAWLRRHGQAVATRGQLRDIGPGLSHKAAVVQLWLWGLQFTQIEQRTAHSEDAIGRYLADFRQIAALHARGASVPEIRAVTGRSAALIAEYVGLYERARREFPAAPRLADLLGPGAKKGGAAVRAAPPHRLREYRRLARRDLASLLRYKFLNEYGYDKGPVVVEAIVADLCQLIRGWVLRPGDLEPGQLVYPAPAASQRPSKGKTIATTKLLPVRLTLVATEDLEAIRAGRLARERRAIRVRRLAEEAYGQGALLSQTDLALLLGSSQKTISTIVVHLREHGELLPLRGYLADMGRWPTHKQAVIRLYLQG